MLPQATSGAKGESPKIPYVTPVSHSPQVVNTADLSGNEAVDECVKENQKVPSRSFPKFPSYLDLQEIETSD